MDVANLIHDLDVRITRAGSPSRVAGVTEDSRRVGRGWIFVARPGLRNDGRRFIPDAIRAGAAAVVTDSEPDVDTGAAAVLVCRQPALIGALLAERLAGSPSSELRLVGVTGTNGKTTVASLVHQLVTLTGARCGMIGTVEIDDGTGPVRSDFTTPPAERLSGLVAAMTRNGCASAVMEVSSHALDQHRVGGLRFGGAVFTNLSGDHLDYHGDMESYAAAKRSLFDGLPESAVALINADDAHGASMVSTSIARVIRCSETSAGADAWYRLGPLEDGRASVELIGPWGSVESRTALIGSHNGMNLLQAFGVCTEAFGIDAGPLGAVVSDLRAPTGRLEPVHTGHDDIQVLVDFAHTDDALVHALMAARSLTPPGAHLWVVFGCGGDKDRSKRPRMGAAAVALADHVCVTSDNPRTEDPEAIIDEVLRGVPAGSGAGVDRNADRATAVAHVIAGARSGDVVVVAGKGHERVQVLPDRNGGTRSIPFSDHAVAREALRSRRAGVVVSGGGES